MLTSALQCWLIEHGQAAARKDPLLPGARQAAAVYEQDDVPPTDLLHSLH